MNASPSEAIDYSRFAQRLAAHRAEKDPARRWDLYREFHEEWGFGPVAGTRWQNGDPVYREVDPDYEEYRSQVPPEKIPAALSEWWKLPVNSFADSRVRHQMQYDWPPRWITDPPGDGDDAGDGGVEALAPDSPLVVDPDDLRMCSVLIENQGCSYWAYQSAEAHLADPPVYVLDRPPGWELQAESLSEYALLVAVNKVPFFFGWSAECWDDDFDFDVVADKVRAAMPELGFHPWLEMGTEIVYHGGLDVVALVDPSGERDEDVVLYGRTREALERLTTELGGEWRIEAPRASLSGEN